MRGGPAGAGPLDLARNLTCAFSVVQAGLAAREDLLHGPAVAVRIAEEDERAPGELLDLATSTPRSTSSFRAAWMSETTSCRPWTEPGAMFDIPVPIAIEQADPGGVSWTKRISSLTLWSWSAWKPTLSV